MTSYYHVIANKKGAIALVQYQVKRRSFILIILRLSQRSFNIDDQQQLILIVYHILNFNITILSIFHTLNLQQTNLILHFQYFQVIHQFIIFQELNIYLEAILNLYLQNLFQNIESRKIQPFIFIFLQINKNKIKIIDTYKIILNQNLKVMNGSIISPQLDSLDYEKQMYQKTHLGRSRVSSSEPQKHEYLLKNLYKQQLDDIMRQKNQQKRIQRERDSQEKSMYNQRVFYGKQAEKLKQISYKNYYQMLLNNQNNISKHYVSPFQERDLKKDRLIQNGIQEEKKRSQQYYEMQQKRNQEMKRSYREELAGQMNQKYFRNAQQLDSRIKHQEEFKKVVMSPAELAKYERQRRLLQMQKYKQDLDKTKQITKDRSYSGNYKNDFNVHLIADRHDPMINPLPYNIQNPYILREFKRKQRQEDLDSNAFNNSGIIRR